jgi:hypothetical protein
MRKDDWGWNLAGDLFDKKGTVLVLIGNPKRSPSQTKFHLDWSRAKNWAIQLHVSGILFELTLFHSMLNSQIFLFPFILARLVRGNPETIISHWQFGLYATPARSMTFKPGQESDSRMTKCSLMRVT